MKTLMRTLVILSAALLLSSPAFGDDPSAFPSSGLDAQSLGRGGTVIACPPGLWSTFGNPATLTPEGFYVLGVDHIDDRGSSEQSWGLSVLDTSSAIRGSLSYFKDPDFAGFVDKMWGVSFSQSLMPSLYLGESFHMGEYEPTLAPGSQKSINTVDAGLLYRLGPGVSLGFVAHNLIPDDRDLLEQYNGFGIGMQFPWTIYFAADYEENPGDTGEKNLRAGIEFTAFGKITGRLGYQDLADETTRMTMGITYTDINGTLDAAVLYNEETEKTDRVVFGLSLRM